MILRPGTDDEAFWTGVYVNDDYRCPAFKPDDVVLDLGLSIGAFTHKAHDQGSRRIYAFEACPDNFAIAKENVGHLDGVRLSHMAIVGDRSPDTVSFPVGNNSLYIQEHATVEVPTVTIHSIMEKVGPVRYLKIDIEGSEWEALYSIPDPFFADIQEIAGEYHQPSRTYWGLRQDPRRPNYDYQTLQQFLQDRGFHTTFKAPTPPPMSGAFHAVRL